MDLLDLLAKVTFDPYGEKTVTVEHRSGMLCLLAFVLSFAFVRTSARMIRAQVKWWPGNVETKSGLHIHHLVWGIFAMLITGFLGFALDPDSPWQEVLAILFGVGAGLTMDEFALWLHLEDVYWAEQGRQSVKMMVYATSFAALIVVGISPLDLDGGGLQAIALSLLFSLVLCSISILKGKVYCGLIGLFIPPVGLTAAIRLAKPDSRWAGKRYPEGSKKLTRSKARFGRERSGFAKLSDLLTGAPDK